MNLPIKELLKESKYPQTIESILLQAQKAFMSWEVLWSPFISAPIKEEALRKLNLLNELTCYSEGGYPSAERQRLCFKRSSKESKFNKELVPLSGINIEGNFLFEKAKKIDFLNALESLGIPQKELGDIWTIRDRGAQIICTPEASITLDKKKGSVRGVEIRCESLSVNQLSFPVTRLPKRVSTVEASTRIDAIASAGFGLSRAKVANQIKAGRLRINWNPVTQASRSIEIGDRIQLEDKGSLEILELEATKKKRWRVELLRQ